MRPAKRNDRRGTVLHPRLGIADYLGVYTHWNVIWSGLGVCLLLLFASAYLRAYFDLLEDDTRSKKFRERWAEINLQSENRIRSTALLQIALAALAAASVLTLLLFLREPQNHSAQIFLFLLFLFSLFQGVPPVRLVYSGYGEVVQAIMIANLVPAFAFSLQYGGTHRLLGMVTFPLTFLHLAMSLALALKGYADDVKYERQTLMVRLGWQRGMTLHNIAILLTYVILGLAAAFGTSLAADMAWAADLAGWGISDLANFANR